jgi:hypothetical protein
VSLAGFGQPATAAKFFTDGRLLANPTVLT